MAVSKINTYLYLGLAADPKPTTAPHEAKFIASDTGAMWINNQGTWIQLTGVAVAITI